MNKSVDALDKLVKCVAVDYADDGKTINSAMFRSVFDRNKRHMLSKNELNILVKYISDGINFMNVSCDPLQIRLDDHNLDKMERVLGIANSVGMLYTDERTGLFIIQDGDDSYTIYIPDSFGWLVDLPSIINDKLTSKTRLKICGGGGLRGFSTTFALLNIENIEFNNFNSNRLVKMASAFEKCRAKLKLDNLDLSHVKYARRMFKDCVTHEIRLPNFKIKDGDSLAEMFYGCKANRICLPQVSWAESQEINRMFYNCTAIVEFKDKVVKFD